MPIAFRIPICLLLLTTLTKIMMNIVTPATIVPITPSMILIMAKLELAPEVNPIRSLHFFISSSSKPSCLILFIYSSSLPTSLVFTNISEAQYLYGNGGRICGRYKCEGHAPYPGRSVILPVDLGYRCREVSGWGGRSQQRPYELYDRKVKG